MLKIYFCLFGLILSATAFAHQYNCKGLDQDYEKMVQQISRKCDNQAQCHLDVLNWTACGAPLAHSDRGMASELIKNRTEIHKICKYVVAPCPSVPSTAHCVSQTCVTQEEVLEKDYKIFVKFFLNDQPLVSTQIVLDYDNGIRCEAAPCPARTVFAQYQTDSNGEIQLNLNQLIKKQTPEPTETISLSHKEMNLSRLGFIHQNQYFSNFNLYDFLAKNKAPFKLEVKWTK